MKFLFVGIVRSYSDYSAEAGIQIGVGDSAERHDTAQLRRHREYFAWHELAIPLIESKDSNTGDHFNVLAYILLKDI